MGSSDTRTSVSRNPVIHVPSLSDFDTVELPESKKYPYFERFHPIPTTLPKEEIASRNISLLACYPLQEWRFFAIKKGSAGHLEVVPKREKLVCAEYNDVLEVVEDSFTLLGNDKSRRFAFLKDRVIEKIKKYGEDLSLSGRDDAAQKVLSLAEKWEGGMYAVR